MCFNSHYAINDLSTLQGLDNGKGHTIGANIGARYSHSKTAKFMDLATHIHFFVNFQVFEWLNHVSLVKIDVLLLIMPNHAGVDDLKKEKHPDTCARESPCDLSFQFYFNPGI